jgi:hypothetical protein
LSSLWADLLLNDEAGTQQAYEAMRELVGAPGETVAFLGDRLKPVPALAAADQEKLGVWLVDLESSDFPTRVRAERAIEKVGERARPALEARLSEKPALEGRRRIEGLLERMENRTLSSEELRDLRAIEVLARLDSAIAKELLNQLAAGGAGARLTEAARAALNRRAK